VLQVSVCHLEKEAEQQRQLSAAVSVGSFWEFLPVFSSLSGPQDVLQFNQSELHGDVSLFDHLHAFVAVRARA
jgi:hypothetical protein